MKMIDTHAHLLTGDTKAYPPSPPSGSYDPADLENAMTVERLLEEMDATGVDRAVLVQRGSIYGFDSSYVCDSAARFPERLAAVCSIDATAQDCADKVGYWIKDRGASGIRLMELVKGMDISWLDSALARDAWKAAAELDVPVCVHFFPWNRTEGLARLGDIMGAIPGLTVVIDHFGAIRSDAGAPDHGVDDLLAGVAAHDGCTIKFTTIPLGRLDSAGIDTRPVVKRVMDLFGAERMMWGSDITQSPGTYERMVALGRNSVDGLSTAEQEQILAGTAARVYGRNGLGGWN
ncbi:MAG: amidohydrolase [Novosphingobium sp.]|nr:amidohydrolase [Novosphingobium sp.]